MKHIKSSQILLLIGMLLILATTGFFFLKIFQATPPAVPELSKVLSEPKTIGVMYVRQNEVTLVGLKEGLKELGYTNLTFKEILLESKSTTQDVEALTEKLVNEGVDLLYSAGDSRALGALNATKKMGSDTPIVYTLSFHNPVAYGLAQSFVSSGNNATGVATNIVEVIQKQLEFLKRIRPDSKKIGVFGKGFVIPDVGSEFLAQLKKQAPRLGYQIVEYTTDAPPSKAEDAWRATATAIKPGDIDATYHIAGHFYPTQEVAETELATRLKIPMVAPLSDMPSGGHFGYDTDYFSAGKQTAKMVDKIFRGIKPTNIPLENIEKIFLIVYPVRAQAAGVVFPESILRIADTIVNDI